MHRTARVTHYTSGGFEFKPGEGRPKSGTALWYLAGISYVRTVA